MNTAVVNAILAVVVAADETYKPKASIELLKLSDSSKVGTYETILSFNGNNLTAEFTVTSKIAFVEEAGGNKMQSGVWPLGW